MKTLQAAGIPAGVVQTPEDLFKDDQLKYREHFKILNHPEIGNHNYEMPAFRLSENGFLICYTGETPNRCEEKGS